jgi:hypothetical protein
MNMPPKMNSSELFWWGLGILAGAVLGGIAFGQMWVGLSGGTVIATVVTIALLLGIGLIVASVVVKALTPAVE